MFTLRLFELTNIRYVSAEPCSSPILPLLPKSSGFAPFISPAVSVRFSNVISETLCLIYSIIFFPTPDSLRPFPVTVSMPVAVSYSKPLALLLMNVLLSVSITELALPSETVRYPLRSFSAVNATFFDGIVNLPLATVTSSVFQSR